MISEKPLQNCIVGISISESEDMERLGFDADQMNRCVVRLSEALLACGARIAFGHDWRPGGVMEAVASLAARYGDYQFAADGRISRGTEPIINRVAPPDKPYLKTDEDSARSMARLLKGIVDARQIHSPEGASRSEALTYLRKELVELCDVRICLGGKLSGYSGALPGILEEALLTYQQRKPVFVSGIFGGASQLIVDALGEGRRPLSSEEVRSQFSEVFAQLRRASTSDRDIREREEDVRLWESSSVEQCIELILRGIVKRWRITRNLP